MKVKILALNLSSQKELHKDTVVYQIQDLNAFNDSVLDTCCLLLICVYEQTRLEIKDITDISYQ